MYSFMHGRLVSLSAAHPINTRTHIRIPEQQSVGAWIHAAALGRDAGKGVFTRPPPQTLIVEASFNQNRVTVVRACVR